MLLLVQEDPQYLASISPPLSCLKALVASVWPLDIEWPCPIPEEILVEWLENLGKDGVARLAHYRWEFQGMSGPADPPLEPSIFEELTRSLSGPPRDCRVKMEISTECSAGGSD